MACPSRGVGGRGGLNAGWGGTARLGRVGGGRGGGSGRLAPAPGRTALHRLQARPPFSRRAGAAEVEERRPGRLWLKAVGQEAGRGAVAADVRVAASRVAEVEPEHLPYPHPSALLQQRVEALDQDLPLAQRALRLPTVGGIGRGRAPADLADPKRLRALPIGPHRVPDVAEVVEHARNGARVRIRRHDVECGPGAGLLVDVTEEGPSRESIRWVAQKAREHHLRLRVRLPDHRVREGQQLRVGRGGRGVHRSLQVGFVPDLPGIDRQRCLAGMLRSVGAAPVVPARAVAPDRRAQVRAPGVSLRLGGDRRGDRRARHPARRSPHHRQHPDPLGGEAADHGVGRGPIPASRLGLDVRPVHRPAHGRGAALLQHQHIAAGDVLERVIEPEEARRGRGPGLRRRHDEQRGDGGRRLPVPELFGRRVSLQVKRVLGDASARSPGPFPKSRGHATPITTPTACRSARITSFREGRGSKRGRRRARSRSLESPPVQRSGTTHTRQLWSFQGQWEPLQN